MGRELSRDLRSPVARRRLGHRCRPSGPPFRPFVSPPPPRACRAAATARSVPGGLLPTVCSAGDSAMMARAATFTLAWVSRMALSGSSPAQPATYGKL